MVAINTLDVIAILRAEMFEVAVFEGMGNDIALIVGSVVPVPLVIVYVGNAVDAATRVPFDFGLAWLSRFCRAAWGMRPWLA